MVKIYMFASAIFRLSNVHTDNAVACSLEWWSFELLILLSGLLPNPELETSVLSVWYAFCLFFFFCWLDHLKKLSDRN